jgi:intracellular septation protein A
MRKLNNISFLMIAFFVVNSIAYSEESLFRWALAISFMLFGFAYSVAKLARKESKKHLIGGEKLSIA